MNSTCNFQPNYEPTISSSNGGSGTVTSVALSMPLIFAVVGSPITTSGTFTVTLASQSPNLIFASPDLVSGSPTFRALVEDDLIHTYNDDLTLNNTTTANIINVGTINANFINSTGLIAGGSTVAGYGLTSRNGYPVKLRNLGETFSIDLQAPNSLATNYTITLPSSAPASNTYLKYNGTDYVWDTPSSSVAWGSITGTLSAQTDLQTALDGKLTNSISTAKLWGRTTAGTGAIEELSVVRGLTLTGGQLGMPTGSTDVILKYNGTNWIAGGVQVIDNGFGSFAIGTSITSSHVANLGNIGIGGNTTAKGTLNNIFIGAGVGAGTIGSTSENIGIGTSVFNSLTGSYNVAIGYQALRSSSTSTRDQNIAIGYQAMGNSTHTTGYNNIAIGRRSAPNITSGYNNVLIGNDLVGTGITTGSANIYIGDPINSGNNSNTFGIGYGGGYGVSFIFGDMTGGSEYLRTNGHFEIKPKTSATAKDLRFYEDNVNGTNYVGFKAPSSISADKIWTLPSADGTSGQVLTTNGSGTLSFSTVSGGGTNNVYKNFDGATYTVTNSTTPATIGFTNPIIQATGKYKIIIIFTIENNTSSEIPKISIANGTATISGTIDSNTVNLLVQGWTQNGQTTFLYSYIQRTSMINSGWDDSNFPTTSSKFYKIETYFNCSVIGTFALQFGKRTATGGTLTVGIQSVELIYLGT